MHPHGTRVQGFRGPGTLVRHQLQPRHLPPRPVDVWLPPDFGDGRPRAVVYGHDGQNLFEPGRSFGGVPWSLHQAALWAADEGGFPTPVLVGVWNTGEGRYSEYTPPEPMRRPVGGGLVSTATMTRTGRPPSADRYVHMLVNEVVPWVEAGYGPPPDRAQRFVLGSSMGGLVSLYAAEAVPSWFGGAGCLSTHFVLGGDPMVDWYAEHLPGPGAVRLWFDRGTEELDSEYRPFQDRMDAALRASDLREGLDWVSRVYPGTGHNEAAWAARAHEVLRFLIAGQAPA